MLNEKERIKEGLRLEIEKCEGEIVFHKKNIEIQKNALESMINTVKDLEFRIDMLQKFILTLGD